jgi:hypothetical protein
MIFWNLGSVRRHKDDFGAALMKGPFRTTRPRPADALARQQAPARAARQRAAHTTTTPSRSR